MSWLQVIAVGLIAGFAAGGVIVAGQGLSQIIRVRPRRRTSSVREAAQRAATGK